MKSKAILSLIISVACCFNALAASFTNVQKVVAGNTQFAVNLYDKLRTNDGNVFFSPYSISTALAMTYSGARGETASQMAQVLQFHLPAAQLPPAFAGLQANLNTIQREGHVQLAVANSLWPQSGFTFLPAYLALCKKYYDTSIRSVDFAGHTEAARNEINGWVEDKTQKKIVELLKPGTVDGSTRLVLVNAIYFKGSWANKFDAGKTQNQPFHVSPETTTTVPLMEQTDEFGYAEFPDLQALSLSYAGNELSMVVLLPGETNGLGKLESQLTAGNLQLWTSQLWSHKVHVFLPKFTVTCGLSLADTLASLGMTDAFDSAKADFSGMDGRKDLFISHVIHKAYVKVDEEGTEAAAATAVTMMLGAMPMNPPPIPVFRADHPFLFLIRDNQTGSILFLGRVTDPAQDPPQ